MVVKGDDNVFRLLGQLTAQFVETGIISQVFYFSLRVKLGYKKAASISAIITLLILVVLEVIFNDLLLSLARGTPLVLFWFVLDFSVFKPRKQQVIEIKDEENNGEINEDALNRYLQSKQNIKK